MTAIKEKKEVTQVSLVVTGHKCDGCGKVVNQQSYPNDWFGFSSHHNGWGNDSVDSYEYYDVCSPRCYMTCIETALKDLKGYEYRDAEVADMSYEFAKRLLEYSRDKNLQ